MPVLITPEYKIFQNFRQVFYPNGYREMPTASSRYGITAILYYKNALGNSNSKFLIKFKLFMVANLIPFRTLLYEVPANLIVNLLSLLMDREIRYEVKSVSEDKSFLNMLISINLAKTYQREAIPLIEEILKA